MIQTEVELDTLPIVGYAIKMYFTIILDDGSLNLATINNASVLYGSAEIINNDTFKAANNLPLAIGVNATLDGNSYFDILYTKAVTGLIYPNTTQCIIQKVPLGVFDDFTVNTPQYALFSAYGDMLTEYYKNYFTIINNAYSSTYSQEAEYTYNDTKGLLSTSTYSDKVIQLLAASDIVHLNSFDLELFISKYIYYRLGLSCAVYLNDHVLPPGNYWILGQSTLGNDTYLAPDGIEPVVTNLDWIIYNSSTFSNEFKNEVTNLIIRISRADIGNSVGFNNITNPIDDNFTLIGPTYLLDKRLEYDRCTQYVGDDLFPLNVIGYQKNY